MLTKVRSHRKAFVFNPTDLDETSNSKYSKHLISVYSNMNNPKTEKTSKTDRKMKVRPENNSTSNITSPQ